MAHHSTQSFLVSDGFGFGVVIICKSNQDLQTLLLVEVLSPEVFCDINTQSYVACHGWFTKVIQFLATLMLDLEISGHINRVYSYTYLPVM